MASDREGPVHAALEKPWQRKQEKKNAGAGVFGYWGQRMTSHPVRCPFCWGLRGGGKATPVPAGADVGT